MKAIRKLFEETKSEYFDRLAKNHNIHLLGAGAYAYVFPHPTHDNTVVKVIRHPDPDYLSFIKFCEEHPSNPYLPKLMDDVKIMKLDNGGLTFVFVEKLRPITKEEITNWTHRIMNTLPTSIQSEIDNSLEEFGELLIDLSDFSELDWELISKYSSDKHLAQFAKYLFEVCRKDNVLDLHDENTMP